MRHGDDEHAACGIGFLASRKGVAERQLVQDALALCGQFDHRGAPGHGAGLLLDIPWSLILERFPGEARRVVQHDVAVGMFFLPFDAPLRRYCTERVEDLAALCGADLLGWADVPFDPGALPPDSAARRTAPVVRQALLRRPCGMSEDGWFVARYLLRLALDEVLREEVGDAFKLCSLSNRTIVYKGLAELSRIAQLYPDLDDPQVASRFVLFHSRYSTNTTAIWRRAQPFWALAHNGEIATIRGNVAWMDAIGRDLLHALALRHPPLAPLASMVRSIIAPGGSDSANLDDMLIALVAGGMTLPESILALLPEAPEASAPPAPPPCGGGAVPRPDGAVPRPDGALPRPDGPVPRPDEAVPRPGGAQPHPHRMLHDFHEAMAVWLGACDGPAAVVACDGDEAVAHLDRNALRPLWIQTTPDVAVAASELTGTFDLGPVEAQRLLGPGDTVSVSLRTGEVLFTEGVHAAVARRHRRGLSGRETGGAAAAPPPLPEGDDLRRLQVAFGMTREDVEVVLEPLARTGKVAIGAMGDDTPPAAMLDRLPRRLDDYFKLRFAQETSPAIDPIRDAWVFEAGVALGDRSGLWSDGAGRHVAYPHRVLSPAELAWLRGRDGVTVLDLTADAARGPDGIREGLLRVEREALEAAGASRVLVLSDRRTGPLRVPLPAPRAVSRLHTALVRAACRHRVGLVADTGAWDVHHAALLVALGADAVCPWLGAAVARERTGDDATYLAGLRDGFVEAMSMMGVTPAAAYCGARLVEAIGLARELLEEEFPGVPGHLGGIGADVLDAEAHAFHAAAFAPEEAPALVEAGEFFQRKGGRPHAHDADVVRAIHRAAGYARRPGERRAAEPAAFDAYERAVDDRAPLGVLDLLTLREREPVPLDEVEDEAAIAWRFMVPGMSEGALSEPAHRALARAMNVLRRWCRMRLARAGRPLPPGPGPLANSGEGGFDKSRMGRLDGNRSVQYAGARFTITPFTAALAEEAEIKFAQGAKPGKGGQLPGRKVAPRIAAQRGCLPGFELVSPPVNHNLYSIEDVKLMLESWRHLNPRVSAALKFVATAGVEMVALGGVNAGANRLHLSDGCGGTGAAKRVDQKHAGVPVAVVLPRVHDLLLEEGLRDLVEISVDGGVQGASHLLKLVLLGADRVAFGTTLLMTLGCSMLRQCHLAGAHPDDPTGQRRIGCTPGVATQDPALVARFSGATRNVTLFLRGLARAVRARMAQAGIRSLAEVVGRRDLLRRRDDLSGKAARLDVSHLVGAPPRAMPDRRPQAQSVRHRPRARLHEIEAARRALGGAAARVAQRLTNADRGVGVAAAGEIARRCGDTGLPAGRLRFEHTGVAGHFYAAYAVDGMEFRLRGSCADSCFTAAYGGLLVIAGARGDEGATLVGNTFGYGARGGRAYVAGGGGNRFGICLRRNHEGGAPRVVVQGVLANAFQYMTGGTVLVLGPVGRNLGAGMTGGVIYVLDLGRDRLNGSYVAAHPLADGDEDVVRALLAEHAEAAGSRLAAALLGRFDRDRFSRVVTRLAPEPVS